MYDYAWRKLKSQSLTGDNQSKHNILIFKLMKKQKLSLDQLKVKSFITTDQKHINGGEELKNETLEYQLICAEEGSHMGNCGSGSWWWTVG